MGSLVWSIESPALRALEEGSLGICRSMYFSPKSVLGRIAAVTLAGISLILSGLIPSVRVAPLPCESILLTCPTITPRTLTSAFSGSWRPIVWVFRLTLSKEMNFWVNTPLTSHTPSASRPMNSTPRSRWFARILPTGQPASLTVVVEPQMAMDRNRSMTLTATIEVRTARPTATPTPAGPPLAV